MRLYRSGFIFLVLNNIKKIYKYILLSAYDSEQKIKYFRKEGIYIGKGCEIHSNNLTTEPYLLKIGDHVKISLGAYFVNHYGAAWILREEYPNIQAFGPIVVKNNAYLGKNVIVFPNVTIGNNCIIRTGSVVISNIPDNSIAMGAPARVIGNVDDYKRECFKKWKEQCPPDIILEEGYNWWNSKYFKLNQNKLRSHLKKIFWDNN